MRLKAKRFMDRDAFFYDVNTEWRAEQFGQLVGITGPVLKRNILEGKYEDTKIQWTRGYKNEFGEPQEMDHDVYNIRGHLFFDYSTQNPYDPVSLIEFNEFCLAWKRENIQQTERHHEIVKSYGETSIEKIKRRTAENGGKYVEKMTAYHEGR